MKLLHSAAIALTSVAISACSRAPETAPTPDLAEFDIQGLQQAMSEGALSSRQITQWSLDRIAAVDDAGPTLNAPSLPPILMPWRSRTSAMPNAGPAGHGDRCTAFRS